MPGPARGKPGDPTPANSGPAALQAPSCVPPCLPARSCGSRGPRPPRRRLLSPPRPRSPSRSRRRPGSPGRPQPPGSRTPRAPTPGPPPTPPRPTPPFLGNAQRSRDAGAAHRRASPPGPLRASSPDSESSCPRACAASARRALLRTSPLLRVFATVERRLKPTNKREGAGPEPERGRGGPPGSRWWLWKLEAYSLPGLFSQLQSLVHNLREDPAVTHVLTPALHS